MRFLKMKIKGVIKGDCQAGFQFFQFCPFFQILGSGINFLDPFSAFKKIFGRSFSLPLSGDMLAISSFQGYGFAFTIGIIVLQIKMPRIPVKAVQTKRSVTMFWNS